MNYKTDGSTYYVTSLKFIRLLAETAYAFQRQLHFSKLLLFAVLMRLLSTQYPLLCVETPIC
jgi:hypothetical protein